LPEFPVVGDVVVVIYGDAQLIDFWECVSDRGQDCQEIVDRYSPGSVKEYLCGTSNCVSKIIQLWSAQSDDYLEGWAGR